MAKENDAGKLRESKGERRKLPLERRLDRYGSECEGGRRRKVLEGKDGASAQAVNSWPRWVPYSSGRQAGEQRDLKEGAGGDQKEAPIGTARQILGQKKPKKL